MQNAAKYPKSQCFIQPSGTEDVIHVYAEASTQEAAYSLANSIAKLVDQFLGFDSFDSSFPSFFFNYVTEVTRCQTSGSSLTNLSCRVHDLLMEVQITADTLYCFDIKLSFASTCNLQELGFSVMVFTLPTI